MANKDHVAVLQQGRKAWNQWRRNNRDVRPDLVGANLDGASFIGADLRGANLSIAKLGEANLSIANLSGANLYGAGYNNHPNENLR